MLAAKRPVLVLFRAKQGAVCSAVEIASIHKIELLGC